MPVPEPGRTFAEATRVMGGFLRDVTRLNPRTFRIVSPDELPGLLEAGDRMDDHVRAAADLLSKAPGLGWSSDDHPGHVLFPSFAVLLANRTSGRVSETVLAELESTCRVQER